MTKHFRVKNVLETKFIVYKDAPHYILRNVKIPSERSNTKPYYECQGSLTKTRSHILHALTEIPRSHQAFSQSVSLTRSQTQPKMRQATEGISMYS